MVGFSVIGKSISHYRIVEKLGEGGMGVVYKAEDTRLGRTVALKFLPNAMIHDPEALERFRREAHLISSLNHPHVCSLYDVGETDGQHYLVMEYLEGETLAARLERKPLEPAEALALAQQAGDALDQAHRRGMVHRDMKPSNIMLTGPKFARAKLLDFGLAKMAATSGSLSELATRSDTITSKGSIVGTFQYMAPEQLEGKTVDARTDIFAFGAVLYEMMTGQKAFHGESQASLISAILTAEPPPVSSVQPVAPPALDRAIRKCLAKDPADRWQSAGDLVSELKWIAEGGSQAGVVVTAAAQSRMSMRLLWAIVVVLGLAVMALLAVTWTHFRETPAARHLVRFTVGPPPPYILSDLDIPALAPDGTKLAFTARMPDGPSMLIVRELDSLEAKVIPGTAGASTPFWSPDSQQLGFFSGGKLKKVGLAGGPPVTLADGFCCGTWNRDGVILFTALDPTTRSLQIHRTGLEGGMAAQVTRADPSRSESGIRWPVFLPDGRRFLYLVNSSQPDAQGIYAASLDSELVTRIMPATANVAFVPPDWLVFPLGGQLMAQAFDWKGLRLGGEAVRMAEGVAGRGMPGSEIATYFSAVTDALAYIPGTSGPMALTWLGRKGNRLGTVGEPDEFSGPALSPNEEILAVARRDPATQTRDIWLIDLKRGTESRLTFDPADDCNPAWSPNGSHIAFTSARKGKRDIYEKAASGIGDEKLLLSSEIEKNVEYWSPDDRLLLFNVRLDSGLKQVWALPREGERKPFAILSGPVSVQSSPLSADGKFIAYQSAESKRLEIFIQNFPLATDRWQISTAGGTSPQWRSDGKELFYLQGSTLMAVDVKVNGSRLERGIPHVLFTAPFTVQGRNLFVPSRDGQKFLAILNVEQTGTPSITVELNWMSRLKR
jgi:Tol biopolymer transport system component